MNTAALAPAKLESHATVAKVNAALRALGFTLQELEFVRGHGYCYIVGSVADELYGERSMYDAASVGHCSVRSWLRASMRLCVDGLRYSDDEALQARVASAHAVVAS